MLRNLITLITALLLAEAAPAPAQTPKEQEAKLIAVLQSDAPRKEKADACRELGRVGTKAAVPALATLLADDAMNHMARYALETIPDPAADEALRAALDRVKGRNLVGVIGSLGVRRDPRAVKPLGDLLRDADADVAQAAARALGKIGNAEAANLLRRALQDVSDANQLAFCEGLFRCAEALQAAGARPEATAIYDQLRGLARAPHQVRSGALRGAILSRGPEGLALLRDNLANPDYLLFATAVRTSMEMPGQNITTTLADSLTRLPADNRVVIIQALAGRGDAAALPALTAASKSGEKAVRLAALRALAGVGQASAAPVLIEALSDSDRDLAQAAQESLAALPGRAVDEAILALLASTETDKRVAALDLIARRRMTGAVPVLLKTAGDSDAKVRAAAMRRVGELATVSELPALLDFLMQARGGQDVEAAEQAVSTVCTKAGSPESCAETLAGLMGRAAPAQKSALVRILSALGGPAALKAVRAAVSDSNAEVHSSAIRALGDWKTADAAPDLLALAKAATDPTDRQLCLRSYLGLARNPDLPAGQRLTMCRDVAGLIQTQSDKRLLLSALGSIQSVEAVSMIVPYLDDAQTKDEAGTALVSLAERLLRGREAAKSGGALVEPLQKVAQNTANADLAKRAQELLKKAQGGQGGRR